MLCLVWVGEGVGGSGGGGGGGGGGAGIREGDEVGLYGHVQCGENPSGMGGCGRDDPSEHQQVINKQLNIGDTRQIQTTI